LTLLFVVSACSRSGSNSVTEPAAKAGASPSPQRITSEGVVKVAAQPVQISAGQSGEAVIRITIQNGYHVNANPPTYSYLKATELEVSPAEGVSLASVTYPKAQNKKFPFAEKLLAVYEGEADLKATLKTDKAAKKGERSIPARLRIQACDDQVYYPPGTVELSIPVNVS
jgi:DsbC/DsbD-like thiol-disulfide interchange protein